MKLPQPKSLNGLILVGFGLVALPLLIAVFWALFNLDRLAEQSEQLVVSGVTAAENNRQLAQQVASLERVARQFVILRNEDSLALLNQDIASMEATLDRIWPLAEQANATTFATGDSGGCDAGIVSPHSDRRRIMAEADAEELPSRNSLPCVSASPSLTLTLRQSHRTRA